MPTITVQSRIARAETILQDTTNTRWPVAELLEWFNDGQREIVMRKPDAYTTRESVNLVAGTRQSLPATAVQLIDVPRNMGTDGLTPGGVVRLEDRRILDDQRPDWHTETAVVAVEHYCFDARDPKQFFVYPPADGTGSVEVVYSAAPADVVIGDIDGVITLDDIYANAMLDYMLYRAYSKDADYTENAGRASGSYQAFLSSLGLKEQVESINDPV